MHYDIQREAELEVERMIANQPDPLTELMEDDDEPRDTTPVIQLRPEDG